MPLLKLKDQAAEHPSLRVLIICQGNICRSPYAEHKLRQLVSSSGQSVKLSTLSAGLNTRSGLAADPDALRIAGELKVDLSSHSTRELSQELIDSAQLLIVMTPAQKKELLQRFQVSSEKLLLLAALDPRPFSGVEIRDPYEQGDEAFRRTYEQINLSLSELIRKLSLYTVLKN